MIVPQSQESGLLEFGYGGGKELQGIISGLQFELREVDA